MGALDLNLRHLWIAVLLVLPLSIINAQSTVQHGKTVIHEIRMTGRFDPATIEAHAGDSLRFVLTSGGPHNVEFVGDSIAAPMRALLTRAMPGDKIGPLSGPLLINTGETYAFKIPDLLPGRYPFVCLPHMTSNMRGVLVIVR